MSPILSAAFSLIYLILCLYLGYKCQYLAMGYLSFAYIAVWLIVDTIQKLKL
jgi:hypothetical protein